MKTEHQDNEIVELEPQELAEVTGGFWPVVIGAGVAIGGVLFTAGHSKGLQDRQPRK